MLLRKVNIVITGELGSLVTIRDQRFAMLGNRLADTVYDKTGVQGVKWVRAGRNCAGFSLAFRLLNLKHLLAASLKHPISARAEAIVFNSRNPGTYESTGY